MRIGYFGRLCLLVESQSAYPVHFAVNASMDRAICCLYPVHYAVNGKIDRAICCLFPVHYAVNGKIDRAFYCLYPVYYAVNASMDRDFLLLSKNLLPISGSDEKWQDDHARIFCLYRTDDEW